MAHKTARQLLLKNTALVELRRLRKGVSLTLDIFERITEKNLDGLFGQFSLLYRW